MIQTEQVTIGNVQFTRTWSDANRYVVRDGASYDEAFDPTELNRTYTEGDIIHDEEESSDIADYLRDGLVTLPSPDPEPDYLNEREPEPDYFA